MPELQVHKTDKNILRNDSAFNIYLKYLFIYIWSRHKTSDPEYTTAENMFKNSLR